MTRSKRQYGSGCLLKRGKGWAIRWREMEIAPDGTRRKAQRYEALGEVTRKLASDTLAQRMAAGDNGSKPMRSRVAFRTLAAEWEAHVLPMYKHSTQKNHRHILEKHLLPRFGDHAIAEITRQEVQAYVAHLVSNGYAPKTTDHIHDVLSAVLRTAVKWGHLQENPARGVDLPALINVRPKWALTIPQATALLEELPAASPDDGGIGSDVGTSARRALCASLERLRRTRPKPDGARGGLRRHVQHAEDRCGCSADSTVGGSDELMVDWRARVKRTDEEALVFSTWSGKPISPNNVLRRWIVPACDTLGLKRVSWLTLRRTYSSWAHEKGVPGKVIAQLMGHAKVDTTLNVYTQVVDGSLRRAADTVGSELFTIVHKPEEAAELSR
jgi:integrase